MSASVGVLERVSTGVNDAWSAVHVSRYLFAKPLAKGARVLDIACGTGYGLKLLAEAGAASVAGVDLDWKAAQAARAEAGVRANVLVADGTRLPFADGSFDLVTSFETLEHLGKRPEFLFETRRVLTSSGTLMLSTPNAFHTQPSNGVPKNPFHLHEYTREELELELGRAFTSVEMLGQTLDSRYVIPPFWDEQEQLPSRMRSQVLLWRAMRRLPISIGDRLCRIRWGHPLCPGPGDFQFTNRDADRAPVLFAICRSKGAQ